MTRLIRFACWMTLGGLGLFVWSVVDPDPVPIMFAMSVGQGIGTLASLIYVYVVVNDLRRKEGP